MGSEAVIGRKARQGNRKFKLMNFKRRKSKERTHCLENTTQDKINTTISVIIITMNRFNQLKESCQTTFEF